MIREVLVVLLLFAIAASKIRFQTIGVKGTLMCGEAPTPGIRIRLWDNDMGELVDSPKQNSFTDFDGHFEFDDWTPYNEDVDPIIRIAHDCNDGVKPGQRLFKFKIPKSYIVQGKEADKEKYFNLGTINLEFKPFNEERYYKGDINKRSVIRPYPHKVYRARRAEPIGRSEVPKPEQPKFEEVAAESSEEDPCAAGLCSFSNDRKRRELEEISETGDEIVKEESVEEEEGCASEGACPIHLTKKKRDNRGRRAIELQNSVDEEDSKSDEIIKKDDAETDSGCSDGACSIDLAKKKRANQGRRAIERQDSVHEDSKSDEIIKKDDAEVDSGCSDGACSIDLTRKRRHENPDVECSDVECPINIEKAKKNATKTVSKFRGRDESPEDRNEPW